tara:strand:- start:109 stop:621 length:513 start_codon:yes stop_codon:yes gene_type:complete
VYNNNILKEIPHMTMTTMEYYDKNVESNGTYVPVERYVDEYCKALTENYKQDTIRSLERSIMKGDSVEYFGERLSEVLNGKENLDRFRFYEGKRYFKVVREEFDTFQGRNEWKDSTVHAFVDRVTGEVYKPASWKAPAKHVRFDMRIETHREFLHNPKNVGWAGGYLYMR